MSTPTLESPSEAFELAVEDLGQPIRGPRALTDDWSRFWHLTYNIARNEFKLKFFGSALGYLWQVMKPLLLFAVLYVFFVVIGHVGKSGHPGEADYGVQLLGSIVLFTFFAESTGGAVRSVVERENLVRKIQFPRLVIPISVVLLAFFNLILNLLVVLVFALIAGIHPMLSWLELPLILAMLIVFATGMAMLLSALFVRARDMQPIWEVFSQILFYASPVIIPLEQVREKLINSPPHKPPLLHPPDHQLLWHIYTLNPLVAIFQQFRHAMINHDTLSAGQALGSWAALLEPMAIVAAIFVLGFWVFNRAAPHIAEDL
ncbi:MAG TPA: ABC transporter permease [Solirubrobacteraceae bacterium]|jgi:ABC-2 type transport system permease protein|nr:ABC transporter permease [Solirubrobacteraceae bacterium]